MAWYINARQSDSVRVLAVVWSSVKASREKERQRILQMAADNRKIAQRIETRQSTINSNREGAAAAASTGAGGGQPQRRTRATGPVDQRPEWRDD